MSIHREVLMVAFSCLRRVRELDEENSEKMIEMNERLGNNINFVDCSAQGKYVNIEFRRIQSTQRN